MIKNLIKMLSLYLVLIYLCIFVFNNVNIWIGIVVLTVGLYFLFDEIIYFASDIRYMKISEIRANREYNKILYTVYFTPNWLGKIFNIKNKTVGFYYAGFKHSLTVYGYTITENGSNAYMDENRNILDKYNYSELCEAIDKWKRNNGYKDND